MNCKYIFDKRTTINLEQRKKLAQEELKLWNDYLNIRKAEMPEVAIKILSALC